LLEAVRIYQTAHPGLALPAAIATTVQQMVAPRTSRICLLGKLLIPSSCYCSVIWEASRKAGAAGVAGVTSAAGGNVNSDLAQAGVASVRVGNEREMTDMSRFGGPDSQALVVSGTQSTQLQPNNNWVPGQSGNANLTNVGGEEKKDNNNTADPGAGVQHHGPQNNKQKNRHHKMGHRGAFDGDDWHGDSDEDYPDHGTNNFSVLQGVGFFFSPPNVSWFLQK